MKVSKEDLSLYTEILLQAEDFRPLVKQACDILVSFGPEIKSVIGPFVRGINNITIESISMKKQDLLATRLLY